MKYFPPFKILERGLTVNNEAKTVTMSQELFKMFLRAVFEEQVDADWYRKNNPDVAMAVRKSSIGGELDHFSSGGYTESRLPRMYDVDEKYYLDKYKDVAASIKSGKVASAHHHYNRNGYFEGRFPDAASEQLGSMWMTVINKK